MILDLFEYIINIVIRNNNKDDNCMSCMYNYYDHDYTTGKNTWKCRFKNRNRSPYRIACKNFKAKYPYH